MNYIYSSNHINFTPKLGFTLIELSIVLVIIGLLTGGILAGQSLVRAAELRSIISDVEKFKAAVYTFRTKYNAVPGDMVDAQAIWGAEVCNTATAQTTTATCNGNGNNALENFTPSGTIGNERFLFWKHLANAGLIAGNYIGIADGTTDYSAITNNAPSGKMSRSLWHAAYRGTSSVGNDINGALFYGVYNNVLQYGGYYVDADPLYPIISPSEAFATDSKFDDGKPGTGNMVIRIGTFNNQCAVAADGSTAAVATDTTTATYRISDDKRCTLIFPKAF